MAVALLEGTKYQLVTLEKVQQITAILKRSHATIALDLETTGLNHRKNKIVTLQFGTVKNAYILDCRPFYNATPGERLHWKETIQNFISSCAVIVGHNIKFDWKFLAYHFDVRMPSVADTMLQELVLYGVGLSKAEDNGISVDMLSTAERYNLPVDKGLQIWWVNLDKPRKFYMDGSYLVEVENNGKLKDYWFHSTHTPYLGLETPPNRASFVRESVEQWVQPLPIAQIEYCVQDVYIPLNIHEKQTKQLEIKDLTSTAQLENACVPAIGRMELDGCYVDRTHWQEIIAAKKAERNTLQHDLEVELNPYIQDSRLSEYKLAYGVYQEWAQIETALIKKLSQTFEEKKITCKGGKSFITVNNTSYSWAKFKAMGIKELKDTYPKPKIPHLDTSPINLGSSVQLKLALSALGVQVTSTDRGHLAPYASKYPIVKKLLQWKSLDKFINAFGDNLLTKVEDDKRIRPSYNQVGAATGRMSSSNPNWQQLPSHEPEETSVRRCVIAEHGNVLLTADFSNIEARILAEMSQDTNLLAFFARGGDLHSTTARLMFNLPEEIDPKKAELRPGLTYRSVAKTINFGLVYGMSPVKLGNTLGITTEDAETLFNKYFEAYPGVAGWLENVSKTALEKGYSETLAGRKRFYDVLEMPVFNRDTMSWDTFKQMKSQYFILNGSYERQAKNAPIQGTNADITKFALILLNKYAPSYVKFVTCVHDEIVLECPESKAEVVAKLLAQAMYKACKKYLHTVYIPAIDVSIETFWKKD